VGGHAIHGILHMNVGSGRGRPSDHKIGPFACVKGRCRLSVIFRRFLNLLWARGKSLRNSLTALSLGRRIRRTCHRSAPVLVVVVARWRPTVDQILDQALRHARGLMNRLLTLLVLMLLLDACVLLRF